MCVPGLQEPRQGGVVTGWSSVRDSCWSLEASTRVPGEDSCTQDCFTYIPGLYTVFLCVHTCLYLTPPSSLLLLFLLFLLSPPPPPPPPFSSSSSLLFLFSSSFLYYNDVYSFCLASFTCSRLAPSGSPPSPRPPRPTTSPPHGPAVTIDGGNSQLGCLKKSVCVVGFYCAGLLYMWVGGFIVCAWVSLFLFSACIVVIPLSLVCVCYRGLRRTLTRAPSTPTCFC